MSEDRTPKGVVNDARAALLDAVERRATQENNSEVLAALVRFENATAWKAQWEEFAAEIRACSGRKVT